MLSVLNKIGCVLFIIGEILLLKEGFIIYAISILIDGIIWAIVCQKVVQNKGYDENWFWLGFWFCIFAFLVAISKPQNMKSYENETEDSHLSQIAEESIKKRTLQEGGWECPQCGSVNVNALITCKCGTKKPNKYEKIDEMSTRFKLEDTGWKCNGCGKLNGEKVYLCSCGVKKSQNQFVTTVVDESNELKLNERVEAIKKYKELLDIGAITQEEYNMKKEQLLKD